MRISQVKNLQADAPPGKDAHRCCHTRAGSCSAYTLLFIHCVISLMSVVTADVYAQSVDTTQAEAIAVTGRPSPDSIILRWAPLKFSTWHKGNIQGYRIERYVIMRNGKLVTPPEKTILTSEPIKPAGKAVWEKLLPHDRYAAIAAQALFGDRFEIELQQPDILTIVNKVRENEQRFAFALFSADMSPATARASGLWFTDTNVRRGERYLYRVSIDDTVVYKGSVFIGPDDPFRLQPPKNLRADFSERFVSLMWDKDAAGRYSAYQVERSADGKIFQPVSDTPITTVAPDGLAETRYEYASDSLPDATQTYYYQVRGITPFGEVSDPSVRVSGVSSAMVTDVPYITEGISLNNKSITLSWDFPEQHTTSIKGFVVERSQTSGKNFNSLQQDMLPSSSRSFEDTTPYQVNYYRVVAYGQRGERFVSPVYLVQLIDSIPPMAPEELTATIDEAGLVRLLWKQNAEPDLYGYRVYKANVKSEELKQITSEPISECQYTDRVDLNTLNECVYYSVMAIDRNQNHSTLAELLKVSLPDKVTPQPPVFLPVRNSSEGVVLQWIKSPSEDVVSYTVYRRMNSGKWAPLKRIASTYDTTYQFTDTQDTPEKISTYTVTAMDDAGLESDPAVPVQGGKIDTNLRPPITWKKPVIDRERRQATLAWNTPGSESVTSYLIYKASNDQPFRLYKTIDGDKREFFDSIMPGMVCKYKVLTVWKGGAKSKLSEELLIHY